MTPFKITAAPGYFVLCGIMIALGLFGVSTAVKSPDTNAWKDPFLYFSVASLLTAWYGGFRIVVADGRLRYRNGFYRWREWQLADIQSVRIGWIGWGDLKSGEKIVKALRFIINTRSGDRILFYIKPFKQDDLKHLLEILHPPVSPSMHGD